METPILAEESAAELRNRLAALGTGLLLERVAGGMATLGTPVAQSGEAVYTAKIDRDELRMSWEGRAVELGRLVRVGRAWTTFRQRRLIVERARVVDAGPGGGAECPAPGTLAGDEVICGEGRLELLEVRPEGRSVQTFDAWVRGTRPAVGERLGT